MTDRRFQRDPSRPCFVISVAAGIVQAHPRTLRIYEDEGLLAPARTPTNIRLYSENDIRRIIWIRRLTQERGINLAGVRLLFELEERLGVRILEALFDEDAAREAGAAAAAARNASNQINSSESTDTPVHRVAEVPIEEPAPDGAKAPSGSVLGAAPGGATADTVAAAGAAAGVGTGENQDGRNGGPAFASEGPSRRPITRIVATRVVTNDRNGERT